MNSFLQAIHSTHHKHPIILYCLRSFQYLQVFIYCSNAYNDTVHIIIQSRAHKRSMEYNTGTERHVGHIFKQENVFTWLNGLSYSSIPPLRMPVILIYTWVCNLYIILCICFLFVSNRKFGYTSMKYDLFSLKKIFLKKLAKHKPKHHFSIVSASVAA